MNGVSNTYQILPALEQKNVFIINDGSCNMGARVVVKELCYSPESRKFETGWGEWFFFQFT
jgi:hypothetical protein